MKKILLSLLFLLVPSVLAQSEEVVIDLLPFAAGFLALAGTMLIAILIIGLLLYVYTSIALMTIAKKLKAKHAWLAWIPLANVFLIISMAKLHPAWFLAIFLPVVPVIGALALVAINVWWWWKIAERRKFPGAISLLTIVPVLNLVMIGILAWGKD